MQRDITDYLEEIMNSGLSKEEKEVLMSALSKKLLQEKEIENEQKETAFKESEVEDDKSMETDSFKEESFGDREIVSNEVKSDDISDAEHSEENKSDFDIIDFCKRNNIEPIELGRIMMTPFARGLSNEQKNILVNYLNDKKIVENIGNYVDNDDYFCNKFGRRKLEVENYKNKIGSFSVSDIDDIFLDISRYYMLDVVINQQHVVYEIFSDEFLKKFLEFGGEFEYYDECEVDDFNRVISKFKLCYKPGELTLFGGNDLIIPRILESEEVVNCFEDFGVKRCSEDNSTEEGIHTVGNFLEFCDKNDIPRFEVSKIMFAPSYKCLDEDELNIVDKLLSVTKQIKDVSQFNIYNVAEASNIIDLDDMFDDYYFSWSADYQSFEEAANSGEIIKRLRDNKRLCFDAMRMMLSKTFLENYDSLVPEGIRDSIVKVGPMKTICDYGSFMDKMKAMYGYRRSLEERTMTSSDREKLYNETIPNMNVVIDKFNDYGFGYSASSSSSIGAR